MKIYKVKVNGKVYEVELESVSESNKVIQAEKTAEAPASAPVAKAEGDVPVLSPMAGKILDVKVAVGKQVKKGETLMILEAMKLENEILAPQDGVVKAISVSKGQEVSSKQELVILG